MYPHPLHQNDEVKVFNIVNGCTANDKVNVDDAIAISEKMVTIFKNNLPGSFYSTIHHEVVTMQTMRKGVKIKEKTLYDMEKFSAASL